MFSAQSSQSGHSDSFVPRELRLNSTFNGTGREVGGGVRMGNTCTPVADAC